MTLSIIDKSNETGEGSTSFLLVIHTTQSSMYKPSVASKPNNS